MLIGWKAIAIFFGYEVGEVEAFRKRAYRAGVQFPRASSSTGLHSVFAYRDTLRLLKPKLHADNRKRA